MKRIVTGEQSCNRCILAVTTVAFFLVIMIPNYSVLAYTENEEGDKPSSDTMFFRVLKGDLNVCSPDYRYNITVCQMVMKEEELLPSVGEVTNSSNSSNTSNTTDSTNSSSYPPLSVNPEMVINEEELQQLLTNSSLGAFEGSEGGRQNGTNTSPDNDTQRADVGKIYVDEYPQYEPLVIEQPLEGETTIDNPLESASQNNQQPLFTSNQTLSNGVHDLEAPELPNDALRQQNDHQDSTLPPDGSKLRDDTNNSKADTSNSYSSIPLGMSLPPRN